MPAYKITLKHVRTGAVSETLLNAATIDHAATRCLNDFAEEMGHCAYSDIQVVSREELASAATEAK